MSARLNGLVQSLQRLFSGAEERRQIAAVAEPARPSELAPPAASEIPPQEPAKFEDSLKKLLANGGQAMSGRVHFLNLRRIRELAAASGRARDEAMHQMITAVIQRHLEQGDFFTRYGDDAYIIIFRVLNGPEANLKCVLIAREAAQRLLGADADADALDVRVAVAKADGSMALQSVSVTDALVGILAREAKPLKAAESEIALRPDGSPDWRAFSVGREAQEATISYTERRAPEDAAAPTNQASPFLDALHAAEEDCSELELQMLEQRRAEKEAAEAAQRSAAAPAKAPAPAAAREELAPAPAPQALGATDIRLLYRPVLNVPTSTTAAYAAVLTLLRDGVNVSEDQRYAPFEDAAFAASIDKVLLKKVLPDLMRSAQSERGWPLIIPVRSSTLFRTKLRLDYLKICDMIPEKWRKFVIWELIASGVGLLDTQVLPGVATLKPYGRAVLLRTALDFVEFGSLAHMGVHAVGVDLGEPALPEQEVAAKFTRFARQARHAGLRVYAARCFSETLLAAATAASATYLAGHAIASRVERPEGLMPGSRSSK